MAIREVPVDGLKQAGQRAGPLVFKCLSRQSLPYVKNLQEGLRFFRYRRGKAGVYGSAASGKERKTPGNRCKYRVEAV